MVVESGGIIQQNLKGYYKPNKIYSVSFHARKVTVILRLELIQVCWQKRIYTAIFGNRIHLLLHPPLIMVKI